MHPLDEVQISDFIQAVKGHRYEILYAVTLFTGLREGEALELMWDCVNFDKGTILVDKQLRLQQAHQEQGKQTAGDFWEDSGLVFTNEIGHYLALHTVYKEFKKLVCSMGVPEVRSHDLRHSYAVASIRASDDFKTVQSNLGHTTANFTLDVYGHVTDQMKQASSARMDTYIKDILKLPGQ